MIYLYIIITIIIIITTIISVYIWYNDKQYNIDSYREYKYVVITPAGRQVYLEILLTYLERQKQDFDEWHLWKNTLNKNDISYMNTLTQKHSWIKIIDHPESDPSKGSMNICKFWELSSNPDTIYIRLDDDIVWLEDKFIKKMYDIRIKYPEPFLILGNIINNAVITHLHQHFGSFTYEDIIENKCMGNGWSNPEIATALHRDFLTSIESNTIDKWYTFDVWKLLEKERISINALTYFGKTIQRIGQILGDEEEYVTVNIPREQNYWNMIYGGALCAHYAFFTQREYIDNNKDILDRYSKL